MGSNDEQYSLTVASLRATSRAVVDRDALAFDARILARRGLPIPEIARRLGVSRSSVTRWLR